MEPEIDSELTYTPTRDHKGEVIPGAEKRAYAYQGETISLAGEINGYESNHKDTHEWTHQTSCHRMRLRIYRHTVTCIVIEVKIEPSTDEYLEGKQQHGRVMKSRTYTVGLSLGELVNRIFGPGCSVHEEFEFAPPEVREAWKAYHARMKKERGRK